jgi:hypothetical protein
MASAHRTGMVMLAAILLVSLAIVPVPASQATPVERTTKTTSSADFGPPRPRYVRMVKCVKTTIDEAAQSVRCRRTTTTTVFAVKNGSGWQLASASGVFVDAPYVWSAARNALVFSPALAWRAHVEQQYAHPPASWLPRRIPARPLPPQPVPIDGQGSADSYAFIDHATSDPLAASRFDRCTEIRWTADLTRAEAYGLDPDTVLAVATKAFADVSAVTGYAFRFVGRSDGLLNAAHAEIPERGARDWTHRADIGLTIGSYDDEAGYDFQTWEGSIGYANYFDEAVGRYHPIRFGDIMLNGDLIGPDAPEYVWGTSLPVEARLQAAFRHELGHMLGLDHVSDEGQLMKSVVSEGLLDYGNGDRQGLWTLAAQPCFPVKVARG